MIDKRKEISENLLNMVMATSPNLVVITNGEKLISANKTFLTFMGYSTIEDFLEEHCCICDFFEPQGPKALLKQEGELSWIKKVQAHPDDYLAYMKSQSRMHIFKVHTGELLVDDELLYTAIF